MCQSRDIGPDSLYCGKWRKISNSRHDLDLGLIVYTQTHRTDRHAGVLYSCGL